MGSLNPPQRGLIPPSRYLTLNIALNCLLRIRCKVEKINMREKMHGLDSKMIQNHILFLKNYSFSWIAHIGLKKRITIQREILFGTLRAPPLRPRKILSPGGIALPRDRLGGGGCALYCVEGKKEGGPESPCETRNHQWVGEWLCGKLGLKTCCIYGRCAHLGIEGKKEGLRCLAPAQQNMPAQEQMAMAAAARFIHHAGE